MVKQAREKESAHVTSPRLSVNWFYRSGAARLVLCLALFVALTRAWAAPQLKESVASPNGQSFQTDKTYTLRMEYKDPNGDPITKKNAVFTDESSGGTAKYTATDIDGTDTTQGVTISWIVNGFTQGGHQGYFEVTPVTGKAARYPAEAGTFYTFSVESLVTKFITLGLGILVGLGVIPFVSYFLFRSVNKRGDPSRAARVGLFFGILAVIALFLYLFAGVLQTPLVIAIPIIALVAGLIVIFGRR